MRIEAARQPSRVRAGFATATVLGLIAVIGLLGAGALHDSLFGEQLAGTRLLQQRSMALAELGLGLGLARIGELDYAADVNFSVQPLEGSADSVRVSIRHVGASPLPEGMSHGRLATRHFEVHSSAHTSRGVHTRLAQGVDRVMQETVTPPMEAP